MSQQSHEPINDDSSQQKSSAEQERFGSLTVEDDPDGTTDPADLAGSATTDDAKVGPSANEADDL
ncbi:hypothetical protein [Actinoplanes xinjiangensis]|jgi:hypothetical protein|uniref:Uncharacterized protein n=1 Tax=Actinoplanes xinjiangensis TaxID=512350 RepID=A0A316EEI8_9ACTN|nr:hypothetical protein [Actinoplanes xinjiangensis]PWK28049.1 hypothetical protein BC793_15123 [Actinoplanes xinjiangensis]GIF45209.1 hypothetical protein Axi01nite_95200 [Actinoplanes xinjiangensis]